jgi:hypothetical protein
MAVEVELIGVSDDFRALLQLLIVVASEQTTKRRTPRVIAT